MKDQLFIAFANYRGISFKYKTKLPVYVLQKNNKFTINQTLDSFSVIDVEYLTIHGDHFLVVGNSDDGNSYTLDYVAYRWEAGTFKVFQRIRTNGVIDIHYFTINTRKFISFSNSMYGIHAVSIYEWENEQFSNKIQDIPIRKPHRCNTFTILNNTYIACGKRVTADKVAVLKWPGKQFESFQDLPGSSIVHGRPHIIHANGTIFLAIANYQNPGYKPDIDSFIYRWNGIKFIHHQSIPTHGAMGWDSFIVSGEVFLVVANSYTRSSARSNVKSAVYKMANNKFNLYQQLPTTGTWYVHAFTHKGKQHFAVLNEYNGTSFNLDSQVYIWD